MPSDAAVLPRRKRRRWRPPNLREQQAIRRCSWALVVLAALTGAELLYHRHQLSRLDCAPIGLALGAAFVLLLRFPPWLEPQIVLRYLRTCWTDEDLVPPLVLATPPGRREFPPPAPPHVTGPVQP